MKNCCDGFNTSSRTKTFRSLRILITERSTEEAEETDVVLQLDGFKHDPEKDGVFLGSQECIVMVLGSRVISTVAYTHDVAFGEPSLQTKGGDEETMALGQ